MTRPVTQAAYLPERDAAILAVRDAAILCRAVQHGIDLAAMDKDDRSPVTTADFGSQALICRALEASFPNDRVVAEEDASVLQRPDNAAWLARVLALVAGIHADVDANTLARWIDRGADDGGSGRFWTLDPIDGTKGFLRREQYAIALALIVDGQVEVAAMACPNLPVREGVEPDGSSGSLFVAIRGHGTEVQPLDLSAPPMRVRVSDRAEAKDVRFCESVESGHSAHSWSSTIAERLGITAAPVRLDSQAKYAVVARGDADIYLRLPTKPSYREKIWDHAAGALILTEAGGTVTDMNGVPLDFTRGRELSENRGIVASNGPQHDRVLAMIAETAATGRPR